ILSRIHDVLGPLDWLIGPSGLLNMRLPLLSDLAGQPITIKALIPVLDPEDGPVIVTFLNAIEQLDYISGLVDKAASEAVNGNVLLNFGSLAISNPGNLTDKGFGTTLLFGGGALLGAGESLSSLNSLSGKALNLTGKNTGKSGTGGSFNTNFMSALGDPRDNARPAF